jgi:hypothetical protein
MSTTLLGFFSDYELAEFARTQLMLSGVPVNRITLTAMQGAGQSRIRAASVAGDIFLSSLRTLIRRGRTHGNVERIASRVARGIATVVAHTRSPSEAERVAAVLRNCGAVDISQEAGDPEATAQGNADHDATWPSHLWPAT